jgi:hypothetical protein
MGGTTELKTELSIFDHRPYKIDTGETVTGALRAPGL